MKRRHSRLLDASGVLDSDLRAAYEYCRLLHAHYGKTYYLSTLLLPPAKRPYVHSLYGFARYADEMVDNADPRTRERDMNAWSTIILRDLKKGTSREPVCQALLHTMHTWNIPVEYVEAFLDSMHMDLTVTEYQTYRDLQTYMYGSAAVIGLQMLPILEPLESRAGAHAKALGEAFQLTNFVRDVAEDLARGRVYLPMEDLNRFGVTRERLAAGGVDEPLRALLRFEINRIRELYHFAETGIDMLAESSRSCMRVALTLYRGIIEEIEKADYRILDSRIRVGLARRSRIAAKGYFRARQHFSTCANSTGPAARP